MNTYLNSKIYILKSNSTNEVYIGSTRERYLSTRLSKHKCDFKKFNNGTRTGYVTSFKLMEHADCRIELLELFPCENKEELVAREHQLIKENLNSVNIQGKKTITQQKQEKAAHDKEYCVKNAEALKIKHKEYYVANKTDINQARKETYICECGRCVRIDHKIGHVKTKQHKDFLEKGTMFVVKDVARIICGCGTSMTIHTSVANHNKTKGHKAWLETQK